jgi:hypothetical protein
LAPGDICTFDVTYTVLAGDDDPLDNTVVVHYHPEGFENDITDSDSHSVELFGPSIEIDKECTDLSKIGDEVECTVDIDNTSSADSPDLVIESILDSVQGDLTDSANYDTSDCGVSLAAGDSCQITYSFLVPGDATDPYPNTVTIETHPDGFPNDVDDTDSDSVNLFQPAVVVDKTGPTEATVGELVTYNFTITNTGSSDSPDLILDSVTDTVIGDITADAVAGGCSTLATPGGSCNFTADYTIQAGDSNPLVNVVTVHYHPDGFPNDVTDDDDHSLEIIFQGESCTPGFWQGGNGIQLWDEITDPLAIDLGATLGGLGYGTGDPFWTEATVGEFFGPSGLDSEKLIDVVGTGGTNDHERKAMRDLIAALLNAGDDEINYPDTVAEIMTAWDAAVAAGTSGYKAFHAFYGAQNEDIGAGCDRTNDITQAVWVGIPLTMLGAAWWGRRRGRHLA